MSKEELEILYRLLKKFRDDAAFREEWDQRNEALYQVEFELSVNHE